MSRSEVGKECTSLIVNLWVEVADGQGLLDARLKFVPRGGKGDVGLVGQAAAGEYETPVEKARRVQS